MTFGQTYTAEAVGAVLASGDRTAIGSYLRRRGWLGGAEAIERVEPAGPGNMNLVLRVTTTRRSIVVKHGRPFVERFPEIAAPAGRTTIEARWYGLVETRPELAKRLPRMLGVDTASQALVLSDLGQAADFTGAYAGMPIDDDTLGALVAWLAALHNAFRDDTTACQIENIEMRRLNHEHIFEVPLRPDSSMDLDALTTGLSQLAESLRKDRRLKAAVADLGAAYLGPGRTLLHGDYYPGSWLDGADGPHVIDPEFGFFGLAEFDVGVMLAHLELSGQDTALTREVLSSYSARAAVDSDLAWAFAGVEVMRRLLGVAQLPLEVGLEKKTALLDAAVSRVKAIR